MTNKPGRRKTPAPREAGSEIERPYVPTRGELECIRAYLERRTKAKRAPRVKVTERSGVAHLELDHPDAVLAQALIMEALGISDLEFYRTLMLQMSNAAACGGHANEDRLNFMLAVMKGVEPSDQLEAMLAAQMAAVHMATMSFAQRLAHVETIPQQDSTERAFNKLARTFAAQLEALRRYRTGGEQKVTVEHVTVNDGGRAIVGNVSHGGRGRARNGG